MKQLQKRFAQLTQDFIMALEYDLITDLNSLDCNFSLTHTGMLLTVILSLEGSVCTSMISLIPCFEYLITTENGNQCTILQR